MLITGIADTHLLLPHFKTPDSYVHDVIIPSYIDNIMLFFALLGHTLTLKLQ